MFAGIKLPGFWKAAAEVQNNNAALNTIFLTFGLSGQAAYTILRKRSCVGFKLQEQTTSTISQELSLRPLAFTLTTVSDFMIISRSIMIQKCRMNFSWI